MLCGAGGDKCGGVNAMRFKNLRLNISDFKNFAINKLKQVKVIS